jgi:teichuronic acid biosynthesis glycosyltransferase TuaC
LNVVYVSNLFPNSIDMSRGLFNFNQLRAMRKLGYNFKVVAPVASFPLIKSPWAEEAGKLPPRETVDGFDVYHPRAWYLPKSRGSINARMYRWSIQGTLDRLIGEHQPELLWASFAFPDGVAVGQIAHGRGLRYAVSLLGSDINLNIADAGRRRAIVTCLQRASLVLSKSQAMKAIVIDLGVPDDHVYVDYNGVDQKVFRPASREEACRTCGLDPERRRILFVGNFVEVKNIATLIRAFAPIVEGRSADNVDLVLVGEGPLKAPLQSLSQSLGVRDRVHLPGPVRQDDVGVWLNACDVFCLPSLAEGVPNVVLEAFATGLPVVASEVGGIPEIHPGEEAGALFDPTSVGDLTAALRRVLEREWNREQLAESGRGFSWDVNAERVVHALEQQAVTSGTQ